MRWRRGAAVLIGTVIVLAACSTDRTAGPAATAPPADGQHVTPADTVERRASRPGRQAGSETAQPARPTASSSTSTTMTTTVAPATTSPAPDVNAKAYAVLDATSGTLLATKAGDERRSVGSVMKLLTAYVAYEAGKPHRSVTAPETLIESYEESAIGIYPGERLPRDVLIRALLIVSANDAARALAVDIAGSEAEFAERMTAAAQSLGLDNTRAANSTGLDADGQYSSANDLVALGATLMENPTFRQTVVRADATLHDTVLPATNDWLHVYAGANGIKTGHTTNAGWCILASAERNGQRMIVAVLGSPGEPARNAAASALLDWAFAQ